MTVWTVGESMTERMVGAVGPYHKPVERAVSPLFTCGHPVAPERVEMGYAHCPAPACVAAWRAHRIQAADLALVLVPKQGLAWVNKSDASSNTRSSGR